MKRPPSLRPLLHQLTIMPAKLPEAMVLCVLMMTVHFALAGGRVAVMLNAVELGLSKFQVGLLVAGFAMLPMVLAVSAGRRIDARGAFRPMRLASAISMAGVALPLFWQHWIALAIAAVAAGIGNMGFQIAVQGLLGRTDPATQLRNFAWLAMAMAVSGFSGPLIAGLAIDYLGHRWSFLLLALGPLVALLGTRRLRTSLLGQHSPKPVPEMPPKVSDIMKIRPLRYALGANLLLASAWDTHGFLVPLYGVGQGFSATTIGVILAAFSVATFIVRLVLPFVQQYTKPWPLIHFAMVSSGIYFLMYPWISDPWLLMGLSFMLGISLGSTQPSMLSLLQQYAPSGRKSEVFGLRTALINGSQVSLPLSFGALGTLVGVLPLFAATAIGLIAGAWVTRRGSHHMQIDHPESTN